MQIPPFTLNRQYQEIGSEIESEVSKVLKGCQYIGGQEIAKFEESFSNLIGVENTIGCNSGTDALVLALRALDMVWVMKLLPHLLAFLLLQKLSVQLVLILFW